MITSGNTDTSAFNFAFNLVYDPKTHGVFVVYLFTPMAGGGYYVVKQKNLELSADVSVGGACEKDRGYDSMSSGAFSVSQGFLWKIDAEENRHGAHRGIRLQVLAALARPVIVSLPTESSSLLTSRARSRAPSARRKWSPRAADRMRAAREVVTRRPRESSACRPSLALRS